VYGFNPWAGDWKATGDSRASAQGNGDHRSGSGGTGIYIRCAAFLLGCIRAWQRTVLSVPLSEPGVYPPPTWPLARTDGNALRVVSVAFSPDRSTLAVGDSNGSVSLWSVANPAEPTLEGPELTAGPAATYVFSLAYNPGGNVLAAADGRGLVTVWNLNVNAAIQRICTSTQGP
jgi:WD40 repeat protein